MWIVQELLLARDLTFLCGNDTFKWDDVQQTLKHHALGECSCKRKKDQFHGNLANTPGAVIAAAREAYHDLTSSDYVGSLPPQIQLARMLSTWAGQECSNLRDKVYALVGLVQAPSPQDKELIHVDYYSSLEDLFSEVVSAICSPSWLSVDELKALCITLRNSLDVCPTNGIVRRAILEALSAYEDEQPLPMTVEDFSQKHTRKCDRCSGSEGSL